ncbi:autotransporter domain-containing protein [Mesorhizobium sp. B2-3-4]|uniref:autotransporter family protein n=1 Tax=Mesorhizobium sp. B2-3-4 TaxID=2589959 RepID=UPI00112DC63C|nr:autotransporter domain-containing protein [Mesorhizobium sp. B2-3-4]TPM38716.1 autotransporter domain-containing protein [Mesorhizobium sp. B2-3-4]
MVIERAILWRASLLGGASLVTLALFTAPSRAEEQLFNFYVNGATVGCCSSYTGQGQGPHDTPVPGGPPFITTSSGAGAMKEALVNAGNVGVNGGVITGPRSNDAYDGYGEVGFRQGGNIVTNYGGLSVNRQVDVTNGPGPGPAPTTITTAFANAGAYNAARWTDTITNNTNAPISGSISYFNNLGSDAGTRWVGSSSGNNLATTGNLWLTSLGVGQNDPVITHVIGNNAYALGSQMVHADGSDLPEWQYAVTVAPGQTQTLVLFNILTASTAYDPANTAPEIALGAQLANLLTNNGQPISADSLAFNFFTGMTVPQLQSVINFDFVGLTIDVSRPFFVETDFALNQSTGVFDGGTLKPTTSLTFAQPFVVNAAGGTIDNTNGTQAFSGGFSGTGGLDFIGPNTTILNGINSYAGATTVSSGRLVVGDDAHANASLTSAVTVASGGTLGGSGTVGTTVIDSGGTIAPGNSVGTLSVAGDLLLSSGSTYMVEIAANGGGDRLDVSGTATVTGAKVAVATLDPETSYQVGHTYRILDAASGVTGQFDGIVSQSAFLNFALDQGSDSVDLQVSLKKFGDVAFTRNQHATADALDGLQQSGPQLALYNSLLMLDPKAARNAFDQLSGEIHASAKTVLIGDSHFVEDAINDRLRAAFSGVGATAMPVLAYGDSDPNAATAAIGDALAPANTERFAAWGSAFGSWGSVAGDGNAAGLDRSTGGFLTGADGFVTENVRLGVMTGYSHTKFDADGSASSGESDNYHLGLYGGRQWGALGFRSGLAYTWHDISTKRSVAFQGFADRLSADYDAGTFQTFGELGYRIDTAGASFEPFANLAYVNLHTDSFAEKGGAAALTSASQSTDATFTTLGIRASTGFTVGATNVTARGMLGWKHAFGDTVPTSTVAFTDGDAFAVAGAPIARNAAIIEAGLDFAMSQNTTLGLSYTGQFANGASDNGAKADFSLKF